MEAGRHGGWEAGRHGGWKARKLESPSYCLPRDIGKRTPVCRVGIAHPQGNFDPKLANILIESEILVLWARSEMSGSAIGQVRS